MNKLMKSFLLAATALTMASTSCGGKVPATQAPSPTAIAATASQTIAPPTATLTATYTASPTQTATYVPTDTATPTASPTATPAATPIVTPDITTATYCGTNIENIFGKQYPAELAVIKAAGPVPLCIQGPLPKGAKINAVPYYNQCGIASLAGNNICQSDGGAVVAEMALEYATGESQNIDELFAKLSAAPPTTTDFAQLQKLALWTVGTGEERQAWPLPWFDLREKIKAGDIVMMRTKDPLYNDEFPCGNACPSSDRYFLAVGISNNDLIVNVPLTTSDPKDFQNGRNLVINRNTANGVFYRERNNPELVIMPRVENETPTLNEYTGKVLYCGGNIDSILAIQHPDELAALKAAGPVPFCVQGSAPYGSLIWEDYYYSRAMYSKIVSMTSGPIEVKLILEAFNFPYVMEWDIIHGLYADENGATLDNMINYLHDQEVLRKVGQFMSPDEMMGEIEQGRLIITTVPYRTNDYMLILGVDPKDSTMIVHYPPADAYGKYLVFNWQPWDWVDSSQIVVGPPLK
jgi:hypothetical protein